MTAFVRVLIVLVAACALTFPHAGAIAPIDAPALVLGVHTATGTELVWNPIPGATFYTLYRGADPSSMTIIGVTKDIRYFDADAPSGKSYYSVAVDNGRPGVTSAIGGEGCVAISTAPPGATTHLDGCIAP